MSNSSTHPVLWDEATVIEDKEGRRYSWSLPHGFRGSQHLTTWGRKLLCGQQGGYGNYDTPFGSERACKVCIRIAEKLVAAREAKLAQPVKLELTQDQLDTLHALLNRAHDAYQADNDYWADRAAAVTPEGANYDTILSNLNYTKRMTDSVEPLRALVISAKV